MFSGLLLQGDKVVQLVVLCAEKPTITLLKRVAAELPVQLKQITEEHQYTVSMDPEESAVLVSDDSITVRVFLTSPLLRDPQQGKFTSIHCRISNQPKKFIFQRILIEITKNVDFKSKENQKKITRKKEKHSISSYQFQWLEHSTKIKHTNIRQTNGSNG